MFVFCSDNWGDPVDIVFTVAKASSSNFPPVISVTAQCWLTISSLLNGDAIQAPELVVDAVLDVRNTIFPVFSDVVVGGSSTRAVRYALLPVARVIV